MEDGIILQMLWNRAEQAIDALTAKFGRRLTATAMNILNSRQDAEESVNDTYLAVWNTIPPQRPESLSGFVYRVGRNQALKRLRANTAQKRGSSYELSLDELAECIPAPALDEAVEARALGLAIDAFLDTVSKDSWVIFLRRYWFGDSVKEIARSLGMTQNAVSVRLNRTRQQLHTYLYKEGYLDA